VRHDPWSCYLCTLDPIEAQKKYRKSEHKERGASSDTRKGQRLRAVADPGGAR